MWEHLKLGFKNGKKYGKSPCTYDSNMVYKLLLRLVKICKVDIILSNCSNEGMSRAKTRNFSNQIFDMLLSSSDPNSDIFV